MIAWISYTSLMKKIKILAYSITTYCGHLMKNITNAIFWRREMWAVKEKMKNRRTSLRYKLLLENRAEDNTTRKACLKKEKKIERETREVKPKTSVLWLNVWKKQVWDKAGGIFTITSNQSLQQSGKQNTVKQGTTRTMKPSVLNSQPNIFTDQLDRQISMLIPKIKLGLSVILLHCVSHFNYFIFKNIVSNTDFLTIMLMALGSKS